MGVNPTLAFFLEEPSFNPQPKARSIGFVRPRRDWSGTHPRLRLRVKRCQCVPFVLGPLLLPPYCKRLLSLVAAERSKAALGPPRVRFRLVRPVTLTKRKRRPATPMRSSTRTTAANEQADVRLLPRRGMPMMLSGRTPGFACLAAFLVHSTRARSGLGRLLGTPNKTGTGSRESAFVSQIKQRVRVPGLVLLGPLSIPRPGRFCGPVLSICR